ncbi:PAS domain S-box protein [Microcoleus sp. FACHB-1515]|uniref:sensor histidine kinase n=1 Tax=Cyanophyceae TaxID=3028117 RepID=UPI0016880BC6|nr:ATP-binding protein [Microcoleus sp. FACHB-1515]MBD2090057.1 PAS domain S-box protein [Microcoleus sp. FACHB-1515]
MKQILLCLEPSNLRQAIAQWLQNHEYRLVEGTIDSASFDLCLIDRPSLDRDRVLILDRKRSAFELLPVLLVCDQLESIDLQGVDDVIKLPIDWLELQVRLTNLLQSRQYLQAFQAVERDRVDAEYESVFAALQGNHLGLQRLVESSVIGFVIANFQGQILDANDAFLALLGYTRSELRSGQVRWDVLTPPEYQERDRQIIEELRETSIFREYEKEMLHKNGDRVVIQTGGALLSEAEETVICFVLDVSDRKRIEDERQQALQQAQEVNSLRSRFVSLVTHEFRNPLNVISGTTQLLERYPDWSAERRADCFRRIQAAIARMLELLDDVLLISRAEAGKLNFAPAPVAIEAFCDQLVEEFKLGSGREHRLIFTVQGECGQPALDEKLLRLILSNLIANAIKYSPIGSTVTLELMGQPEAIAFRIRDSGIGIPIEDQPRLFEAFFRAQNVGTTPGTGLGLAIAKQAVELHGGSIAVESEANQGTTFTVRLPIATTPN